MQQVKGAVLKSRLAFVERHRGSPRWSACSFSAPDCLTVVGWYRKALEICGVPGARVVEEACRAKGGAVCRYRVRWD